MMSSTLDHVSEGVDSSLKSDLFVITFFDAQVLLNVAYLRDRSHLDAETLRFVDKALIRCPAAKEPPADPAD
jgi:hypothetical protein